MSIVPFDPDSLSDLKFSFNELVVLDNAALNAAEHARQYLSRDLSDSDRLSIEKDLSSFEEIEKKISGYLKHFSSSVSFYELD